MRSRELPIPGFRSVGCPFPRLPPSASSFSREEIGKSSYGYPFLENEEDTAARVISASCGFSRAHHFLHCCTATLFDEVNGGLSFLDSMGVLLSGRRR